MRSIPMIFALTVAGVCYADAMGWIDSPGSLMHPKSHHNVRSVEIDLTDVPKAGPELPPAVVTMNIEWLAKLGHATMTGDTGDDEEEKKLFWHTEWGTNEGVPFTGWGDPNALTYTVWTATHSPDNPGFHFITDPPPVRNAATEQATAPPVQPTIGPIQLADKKTSQTFQDPIDILSGEADKDKDKDDNSKSNTPPSVLQAICLVDPALPQCIAAITPDPTDPTTPPVVTVPIGPTGPIGPTNPTGPVITGPIVPVNPITAGTIPETSTWVMMVLGFISVGLFGRRGYGSASMRLQPQTKLLNRL